MDFDVKKTAKEILVGAKTVYKIIEENNPKIIVKPSPGLDDDVYHRDYYYFENPQVSGAIIRERDCIDDSIDYYITSTIQYTNFEGKKWMFAKVRIFEDKSGKIKIAGKRTGNCFDPDYEDEDFLEQPDPELQLVLESMKINLFSIFYEITNNPMIATETYDPKWVKSYIRNNPNCY